MKQACEKAAANINVLQSLISASADGRVSIFDLAEDVNAVYFCQ